MPRSPAVKRFVSSSGVRIYRIPCDALPDLPGRVFLLLGAGPPTLVDAGRGTDDSLRQVLDGLNAVRTEFGEPIAAQDIKRVLVTHAHFDHIGGLAPLLEQTNAAVGVHPLDRRVVEAWDERSVVYNLHLRAFLHQAGVDAAIQPELLRTFGFTRGRVGTAPVAISLDDGVELDGVRVIHTPGHSPGHVCLLVGDVLLTGDHVLPRTVTQQWPETVAAYTGMGHYLEALDKVQRIPGIELAMGGHEPVFHSFYARCDEIRQSHLRRMERLMEIIRKSPGPPTIQEMTEKMYSRQKGFHAMLALLDVGSRVEYLEQHARLAIANYEEVEERGVAHRYRPV